jgi:protein O-GlcNAc transferase
MDELLSTAVRLHRAGRLSEAEGLYREVLAHNPEHADAIHLMGMLTQQSGKLTEALRLIQRSVELDPTAPHFHGNLGALLGRMGLHEEAVESLREALRLKPQYAETWHNLGIALARLRRRRGAVEAFDRAVRLRPGHAETYHLRGHCLRELGRLEEAVQSHLKAIELEPNNASPWQGLMAAYGEQGRIEEAVRCQRRRVELEPQSSFTNSDLLATLLFSDEIGPRELYEEHVQWSQRHAAHVAGRRPDFDNDPSPGRRLRIGYLSPDFRNHPVPRYMTPIIESHDRREVEVFCYSDVRDADAYTKRIRDHADEWRDLVGLSNDAAGEQIRKDRIDILVDLAGHMDNPRTLLLAARAAPVQVAYCGYPATTGIQAVDYRITDDQVDPPGVSDGYYTEKLFRIPGCCWCCEPEASPEIGPLPMLETGRVTFAVLNRLAKVRPRMIRLWAQVLDGTPGSRLMVLVARGAENDASIFQLFGENGIPPERLELVGRRSREDYFRLYNRVDIALDTFPYLGTTTTCDALWMGVPVVALEGQICVSRSGVSILRTVPGAGAWVGSSPEAYMKIALRLAGQPAALVELRTGLREKMRQSPLLAYDALTRNLEAAYRTMWAGWCRDNSRV